MTNTELRLKELETRFNDDNSFDKFFIIAMLVITIAIALYMVT